MSPMYTYGRKMEWMLFFFSFTLLNVFLGDVSSGNLVCANGKFGQKCNKTCSQGCDDVCNEKTGSCTCKTGWQGTLCDRECDRGRYGRECRETCGHCGGSAVCHHVNGNCSSCTDDFVLPLCKLKAETISVWVLVGSLAGAVVALPLVVVAVVHVRRRRTGSKDSTELDVQQTDEVTSDHDTQDNVYQNVTNTHNVTRTDSLGQPEKTALKELTCTPTHFVVESFLDEDTGVVLDGDPDPGSDDYINAKYIKSHWSTKTYIAAQGPRGNNLEDFWKMVWQDQVTHIVLLTNAKEGKTKTCEEYWPCPGTKRRYGSVDVTALELLERSHFVMRTFDVKAEDEASRHVTQYHCTTWPVHCISTTIALVDFWRTVNSSHGNQKPASPLLVHCSAGMGLTGTFIALDMLMDHMENQKQVDVFKMVEIMRKDRCNTIHTKSQYRVLHETLFEAYSSRDCRLPVSCFDSMFRRPVDPHHSNKQIDAQFQKLKKMKVLLHKPRHTEAEREENLNKNRYLDVLPGDGHLVRLTIPVHGRNDYINAVDLLTLCGRRHFILTQLPLPDTVVDFWRLVAGNDVNMIVSLGCETDEFEGRNCYWPRERGQFMTLGPISVRLTSLSSLWQHLKRYTLSLQSPGKAQPREVQLLHYGGWKGEIAGSAQDLAQLVDIVLSTPPPQGQNSRPVVVQCENGATKSGLFCAVCDTISRMTSDKEIDVYMAVRNIHIIRPECVTSQAQYRFIYRTVQEYTARKAVHCNTSN